MINAFFKQINATLASEVRKHALDRLTFDRFSPASLILISLLSFNPFLPVSLELLTLIKLEALKVVSNIKVSKATILLQS